MAEPAAASGDGGGFRIPANAHEVWAFVLSLVAVGLLVQLGAPLIRALDFLDPKLQDYAIGISFVAFPLIHRQCKRGLARVTAQKPVHLDLTPWYVSGAITAALLFAWAQFVSACAGVAIGVLHAQIPVGDVSDAQFLEAFGLSMLALSIPMSAVASVFAGVMLNRFTRSHVFAALGLASVLYLLFNLSVNIALEPEFTYAQIEKAAAEGVFGVVMFVVGMGLVSLVVLVFGAIGVAISSFNRERSLGRIIDGARQLSAADREVVAADVSRRLKTPNAASSAPPPAASSFVDVAPVTAAPVQAATAAEP